MDLKIKGLTFCSLVALFAAGQAFAHTGVRDAAEEGKSSYNAFTLTHGCGNSFEGGPTAQAYPVLGQSAVFPFDVNAVWRDAAGAVIQVGGNGNGAIKEASLKLGVAAIAGGSPFNTTQEITDNLGNVQAILWKDGVMAPNMYSLTQFKVTAPTIVDNCVKSLKVRIGVINYCDLGKNAGNDNAGPYKAPKDAMDKEITRTTSAKTGFLQKSVPDADTFKSLANGNGDNNRADWWFTLPEGGSALYNDPEMLQKDYWTELTVNNSATDLAKCTGTQTEVSVEPNGVAFDTYLSGRNTRPFSKGNQGL
jgi:hypothetical protein